MAFKSYKNRLSTSLLLLSIWNFTFSTYWWYQVITKDLSEPGIRSRTNTLTTEYAPCSCIKDEEDTVAVDETQDFFGQAKVRKMFKLKNFTLRGTKNKKVSDWDRLLAIGRMSHSGFECHTDIWCAVRLKVNLYLRSTWNLIRTSSMLWWRTL